MSVIKTVKTIFSYAFFKLLLGKNKKMNSLKYNMCSISNLYIDRVQRKTFRALHLSKKSDYIKKKKTRKKKPTSLYKSNSSLAPLSIEKKKHSFFSTGIWIMTARIPLYFISFRIVQPNWKKPLQLPFRAHTYSIHVYSTIYILYSIIFSTANRVQYRNTDTFGSKNNGFTNYIL